MRHGKYEYWQATDGLWHFNRVDGDGEVEHPSEGYSTKGNAIQAIGRCMADTSDYEIVPRMDMDGVSVPSVRVPDDETTGVTFITKSTSGYKYIGGNVA